MLKNWLNFPKFLFFLQHLRYITRFLISKTYNSFNYQPLNRNNLFTHFIISSCDWKQFVTEMISPRGEVRTRRAETEKVGLPSVE